MGIAHSKSHGQEPTPVVDADVIGFILDTPTNRHFAVYADKSRATSEVTADTLPSDACVVHTRLDHLFDYQSVHHDVVSAERAARYMGCVPLLTAPAGDPTVAFVVVHTGQRFRLLQTGRLVVYTGDDVAKHQLRPVDSICNFSSMLLLQAREGPLHWYDADNLPPGARPVSPATPLPGNG
jgi:hypothetical protein